MLLLALLILPLLEHGGYAITELTLPGETPHYSFVSVVDGVLVSDLVGSGEEVREARDTFLSINTEPTQGWIHYEPAAFSAGAQNQHLPLASLTGSGKHPAAARLNPVSRGPQFITVSLIIALLGTAWYGWQYYERWQTEKAAQAAVARQATEERITPPGSDSLKQTRSSGDVLIYGLHCHCLLPDGVIRWQNARLTVAAAIFAHRTPILRARQ